jgi:Tfp pilus assembly protein PilF
MAEGFYEKGEKKKAIRCYRQAIVKNPYDTDALNNLAVTLIDENRFFEAEKYLIKAIELKPYDRDFMFNLKLVGEKLT